MIKLYIDNQQADINPLTSLSISLSIASLTSTSWGRANYSKSITIPATPHNRRLMGDCEQPLSAEMFNHSHHTARVEVRGCVIIEGSIFLTASRIGAEGYYRFNIIGNAREWVVSASKSLLTLFEEWGVELSEEAIAESFTAEGVPVRFLPVLRNRGAEDEHHIGRILPENYHPFLHLATLVEAIFAKAGYAIESEFMDSEFFKSLYMSGRWSQKEYSSWGEMDFGATRSEASPYAQADLFGRVYASPLLNYNTVGNLVDAPEGDDVGCFGEDSSGRICFTPPREVVAGFEYHLKWESDYRVRNRKELQALTELRTTTGDRHKIVVPNTYADRREGRLSPNYAYNLIVFDHVEGDTYYLKGKAIDRTTGKVTTHTLLTTTERESQFSHTIAGGLYNAYVEVLHEGEVTSLTTDWAIYDGYVGLNGRKVFEATLRSEPEKCSPTAPKYFDLFYFGGGVEGMTMRLLEGCRVRPLFYPHPSMGDRLQWRDVADYSATGLDLLGALKELFDLQIYTDTTTRKVFIEPRREFCDKEVVIDLSESIDTSQPILIEELGSDHPQRLSLCYRSGDTVVESLAEQEGVPYGEWSAPIESIFATEGERRVTNRLFTPSVAATQGVSLAPSASLIVVEGATEDALAPDCVALLNFLPKIVSYRGMKALPEGERWDYPTVGATDYPLLAVHDDGSLTGAPLSLLFEDRDGVEGLHRWWDGRVESLNHSRRVTLHVALRPEEIEQIVMPNSTKHDFRAHYLLTIEGDKVLCRMEEIVDYNPASPSTKVVFVTV